MLYTLDECLMCNLFRSPTGIPLHKRAEELVP